MPFDISGNFTRLYDFEDDRTNGIKILAARMDAEFDNFSTGMNLVFFRDGRVAMTADLKIGANRITGLGDGSAASPAIKYTTDPNTGPYLNGIGKYAVSVSGVKRLEATTTGVDVVGTLSASGASTLSGILTVSAAGTPLVVNSTNSTQTKMQLKDNGTLTGDVQSYAAYPFIFRDGSGNVIFALSTTGFTTGMATSHFHPNNYFGPTTGAAADSGTYIRNTGSYNYMYFQRYSAGVPIAQAQVQSSDSMLYFNCDGYTFRDLAGTTNYFTMDTTNGVKYNAVIGASRSPVEVGFRYLPNQAKVAAYQLVAGDMNTLINITSGGVTIPSNATVAFPVGALITVYNNSGSTQTIAITTDTLRLHGSATTGSRTIQQRGIVNLLKVGTTEWVASGDVS